MYDLLTDEPSRMVRDQANKTFDVFLQRIRKHAQTLPETIQPSSSASNATAPPRMGTPSTESSWAGWAISSFTNKIASVHGQMDTPKNGAPEPEQRPSSVPASSVSRPPPSIPSSTSLMAATNSSLKTSKPNPFAEANAPLEIDDSPEDFADAWDDSENPWGGDEDDPFSTKTARTSTSDATYDDKGEPDFAGWLNAQSQSKSSLKKPLPKGLAKTAASNLASRPALGKAKTTSDANSKRSLPIKRPIVKKKEESKPAEEEAEGWGDEWA
jgi:SCY1-like protein 1